VVGDVPVVVVSVSDDHARSKSMGAVAHLKKPVPTQELFTLLQKLANTKTPTPVVA
jgi:hypothetical protein